MTTLPPQRLERRHEELARDALPCVSATVFGGNPEEGLTVGLWVESERRRDVRDLARVLQSEPGGHGATGWSLLSPKRGHASWRLLLRVHFERPVKCSFVVQFEIGDGANDPTRAALPLLLAANGFALGFDGFPDSERPIAWIPAPAARECVLEVVSAMLGSPHRKNARTRGLA
jgi:hypothetical protein